ncbi:hypothetical protein K2173_023374 [Erythroxylum novogranatense]|uniref:Uncharacterized protein n=1 Tax=Erythroxylum novogranatense TaxID=1862640 RepID=A0AAV8TYB3_9ROSI|nr:hypothetical protein K2173_023374 [Erythroxylum novogranatense]
MGRCLAPHTQLRHPLLSQPRVNHKRLPLAKTVTHRRLSTSEERSMGLGLGASGSRFVALTKKEPLERRVDISTCDTPSVATQPPIPSPSLTPTLMKENCLKRQSTKGQSSVGKAGVKTTPPQQHQIHALGHTGQAQSMGQSPPTGPAVPPLRPLSQPNLLGAQSLAKDHVALSIPSHADVVIPDQSITLPLNIGLDSGAIDEDLNTDPQPNASATFDQTYMAPPT